MQTLNDDERLDWLQLSQTPTIGPITFHKLIAKFGDAETALRELPAYSRKTGRVVPLRLAPREDAEAELRKAVLIGASIIASCEADYPNALKQIADPPPLITMRGHKTLFQRNAVAIVGARNASAIGKKIARSLASELGGADYVIVSGLARGIDGAAHEASLASGTIAVVAGGVDVVYPPEHDALVEQMSAVGAIISERRIGATPTARDFPKRNRLISGLSQGVVIVEAAIKSGTLITARFALEQGREVFAVPGSPLDPRCQGANRLIRDGATLVETAQDVINVLKPQAAREDERDLFEWRAQNPNPQARTEQEIAALRRKILEVLSFTPIHRDELIRELSADPGAIADALLDLVLSGAVEESDGGRFSRSAS